MQRVACVSDRADDLVRLVAAVTARGLEVDAAMVSPEQLLAAASTLGHRVRCGTHPRELEARGVDVWVGWRGERLVGRHLDELERLGVRWLGIDLADDGALHDLLPG